MTWNGSSRADASLPTQIPFSKYIYCKSIPLRILTESNLGSDSKKHQTKNLNLLQNKTVNHGSARPPPFENLGPPPPFKKNENFKFTLEPIKY